MEILVRTVGAFEMLLCWLTAPIYFLITRLCRSTTAVPPLKNAILHNSATELARKIRDEVVSNELR